MMILALQFWAFLLCCLDTVQTYVMYPSSYCHQLLTFGLRQCRFFRFVRQFYQSDETDDIWRRHERFPPDLTSEKRLRGNSILITRHYSDLGSASHWLKQVSQAALPTGRTTQIWVVTRHQFGISALVSLTSIRGETVGGVSKCPLSQAIVLPFRKRNQ